MKSILTALVFIFLFVSAAIPSEWYVGGTLHRASAETWMKSSYNNRLATSADWFTSITKIHNQSLQKKLGELSLTDYLTAIKKFSKQLEKCVSDVAPQYKSGDLIADVASTCYVTMYGIE